MHRAITGEPIQLTYDDFRALPDDGRRYEILDGDLYMSPSPKTLHQRIVGNLAALLLTHARENSLGDVFVAPLDVLLSEHDVVEPDVIFVSRDRASIITEDNIRGVPDLLVEVLSPSTADRDLRDKRNIYARCGVPFYWIIDPTARSLVELRLAKGSFATVATHSGKSIVTTSVFPELQFDLPSLFE